MVDTKARRDPPLPTHTADGTPPTYDTPQMIGTRWVFGRCGCGAPLGIDEKWLMAHGLRIESFGHFGEATEQQTEGQSMLAVMLADLRVEALHSVTDLMNSQIERIEKWLRDKGIGVAAYIDYEFLIGGYPPFDDEPSSSDIEIGLPTEKNRLAFARHDGKWRFLHGGPDHFPDHPDFWPESGKWTPLLSAPREVRLRVGQRRLLETLISEVRASAIREEDLVEATRHYYAKLADNLGA